MKLKDILGYKLIETGSFSLTVYHLFTVVIILVSVWIISRLIQRLFLKQEQKGRLELGTSRAIYQIVKYLLWTMAIVFSLDTVGIHLTFLLASSAALMVGLGLGLQQIFQDFTSGITLIIEGSLKVGDIIQTEQGKVGRVKEINLRTSKIETRDNISLIVPNSKLINDVVINWSHHEKKTRFSVEVGVAYGSDMKQVKSALLECAAKHPSIFASPAPIVRFINFGNSSLDMELLFYTNQTFRVEDVKSDLRFAIDAAFRKHQIHIPFPQHDIHIVPPKTTT